MNQTESKQDIQELNDVIDRAIQHKSIKEEIFTKNENEYKNILRKLLQPSYVIDALKYSKPVIAFYNQGYFEKWRNGENLYGTIKNAVNNSELDKEYIDYINLANEAHHCIGAMDIYREMFGDKIKFECSFGREYGSEYLGIRLTALAKE